MPNAIKYSTDSQSLALKKGNFYIGTGDVGKGPTSTTGYYNGITPPAGGYTIYLNKASGGPSIFVVSNDSELISTTNKIAGESYSTVAQCLSYFAGQTDKMVLNNDYSPTITNGLVLNLDAGFTPSYPRNGTTWYDISVSGPNNVTLSNGPTYNGVGYLTFDGSDDYANFYAPSLGTTTTVEMLCKIGSGYNGRMFFGFLYYDVWCGSGNLGYNTAAGDVYGISSNSVTSLGLVNNWKHYVFEMRSDVSYTNNKIYINGVSQSLSQLQGGEQAAARNFNSGSGRISSWLASLNYPMPMDTIYFRVYNRALTTSEILLNYYQGSVVTSNLVLNLDVGNIVSYESGSTTTYSLSGTSTGTLTNGVGFNTGYGGSWVFDGVDDYISLPSSLGYSVDKLSVFSWFKSNGQPPGNYHIICGGSECEISIPWPGGQLRTGVLTTTTRFVSNHGSGLNDGNWHYIGFTFDGTTKTSYIDGVNVGTQTITSGTLYTTVNSRSLGKFGSSNTYYANGNMGGYVVYDKVLNPQEVLQNFNAQKSRFG